MPDLGGWIERVRSWGRSLRRDVVTLALVGRHPATPWAAKALCLIAVAYALSPVDLIPDFIPVLGLLDDLLLLPAFIWLALRLTPAAVVAECRQRADGLEAAPDAARWRRWAGLAVVALWLLLAAVAVWVLTRE